MLGAISNEGLYAHHKRDASFLRRGRDTRWSLELLRGGQKDFK